MFCKVCEHQYHGRHICEPDEFQKPDFTPLLSAHQIRELEKVLTLAHTTPQSLGCDFHNQALAVMEFFGFAAE